MKEHDFITILETDIARIRAIGVGSMGVKMVRMLSGNMPSITCHEVAYDPKCESPVQTTELLSEVQESELVFIITAFEDGYCGAVVENVGQAARNAGVLTLALIPDSQLLSLAQLTASVDAVFAISEDSMSDKRDPAHIQSSEEVNPMLHMITVITKMITLRNYIGIDFADVVTIMRIGNIGRLGVGMALSPDKSIDAALIALEQLVSQGISPLDAKGVLIVFEGSSHSTLDNIFDAHAVIISHVAENANTLIGFVEDDRLGDNIRLSIMQVW